MCHICLKSSGKYQKLSRDVQALYIATHNEDGKRIKGMNVDDLKLKMKQQSVLGLKLLDKCLNTKR